MFTGKPDTLHQHTYSKSSPNVGPFVTINTGISLTLF